MFAAMVGGYLFFACLGCAAPDEPPALQIHFESATDSMSALSSAPSQSIESPTFYGIASGSDYRPSINQGGVFSPRNLASPNVAAQFRAQELATPMPLRGSQRVWGGEMAFGASGNGLGVNLDVQVAPRAEIRDGQGGNQISRAGAELRLGQGLAERDQRGTGEAAPSWYFFVGQDNEALIWNVADRQTIGGPALRDQVTVGDLQAGISLTTRSGGQMSLGLIEREMSFSDISGQHSISRTDQFAAFTFTMRK